MKTLKEIQNLRYTMKSCHEKTVTPYFQISTDTMTMYELENRVALTEIFRPYEDHDSTTFHIYHDIDQDGIVACACLVGMVLPEFDISEFKIDRFPVVSGPAFTTKVLEDEDKKGDIVFILDHGFSKETYQALCGRYDHIVWIDHHPFNDESLLCEIRDSDCIIIDQDYSSARNVYNIALAGDINYGAMPRSYYSAKTVFIHLSDYEDRYLYKAPIYDVTQEDMTKADPDYLSVYLNTWFMSLADPYEEILNFLSIDEAEVHSLPKIFEMLDIGKKLYSNVIDELNEVMKSYVHIYNNTLGDKEYKVAMVFHSRHKSRLGFFILNKMPEADAVFIVYMTSAGLRVSIRTRQDGPFTANEIATHYGGSGHKYAAGFVVKNAEKHAEVFKCIYGLEPKQDETPVQKAA